MVTPGTLVLLLSTRSVGVPETCAVLLSTGSVGLDLRSLNRPALDFCSYNTDLDEENVLVA